MRKYRKQEHLENFLKASFQSSTLFEDVFLYHDAISNLSFKEIDTSTIFLGKEISFPFMINAITGGNEYANGINKDLANLAKELNIPIAVGSQKIALDDPDVEDSFKVVREYCKDGIVIANLSALSSADEAQAAIDMIGANAIQLHLNVAQELVMQEGDRDFATLHESIKAIINTVSVPVILKETGTGLSGAAAKGLYDLGVKYVDISGSGGTNFIEIEDLRNPHLEINELYGWGIPTALSLYEVVNLGMEDLNIVSSGGIKNALDVAKSMVMGAHMTAGSGELINYLIRGGYDISLDYLESMKNKFAMVMMLQGASNLSELKNVRYKITGRLKELIDN